MKDIHVKSIAQPGRMGHHPNQGAILEGWTVRRCMCGFILLLSPSHTVWWLLAKGSPTPITSLADLYAALAAPCKYYQGLEPRPRQPRPDTQLIDAYRRVKEQFQAALNGIKTLEALAGELRDQNATTVPGRFGPTVIMKRKK